MSRSFALLLLLAGSGLCYADVSVARHGLASCVIVSPRDASTAEMYAAKELQETLGKITGAEIPLQIDATALPPRNAILVGQGTLSKQAFPDVNWSSLGEEQTLIRSKGSLLLISGGRARGTLYAVDRVLNQLGVRWWAPWATQIPHQTNLTLRIKDQSETPAFEYRDPFWVHTFDGTWAVHNFDNGFNVGVGSERGGKILYQGFVHTYNPLVPPAKYFAIHPEWYSLIKGKRTATNAQLCTTNPELRDFVVEQVRQQLRDNPSARIVSVSQNDCFNPCQCDNCRALVKREGSESALVLDLANYVAEHIEKEFPNVAVDTLAYQWSRHAPSTMRPRPNVIVRLCSIECNFAYPLDAPQNEAFAKDVRDWSRLTNRLYIWDYCTDFAHYVQPQPDYYTLGETLSFFADHGVKGVFEEGGNGTNGAEMCELKAWVEAQLFWNPKQDVRKLISEFVHGFYGKAAGPILDYLKLMQAGAKTVNLQCWSPTTAKFLGYDNMVKAESLWESAEKLAASDSDVLWRVRQGHLAVQYVWLCRWNEFQAEAQKRGDKWPLDPSRQAFAQRWVQTATTGGPAGWIPLTQVSEGGPSPARFVAGLK